MMVPDPSIMLPPIPFIDDDAGSGAEYMVTRRVEVSWSALCCRTDGAGAPERP